MATKNVISNVVAKELCFGCGLCVGICPKNCLKIRLNKYGEYSPYFSSDQCSNCGICLKCCINSGDDHFSVLNAVFLSDSVNNKYGNFLGKYCENYAGYSNINSHRENGASGGVTTWLLENLLQKKLVDAVICVGQRKSGKGGLFEFKICSTVEEIRNNSKSKYYPVECSDIISFIMKNDMDIAITALPCLTKNLRLAKKYNAKLSKRIKYIISFTCGMGPTHAAAEYICASSGGDPFQLDEVCFRNKVDKKATAKNFAVKCISNKGKEDEKVTYQNFFAGLGAALEYRLFSLRACDFCDDVFGEYADISLMDAWHPKYFSDSGGTSIFIVRNKEIDYLVSEGMQNGDLHAEKIDPQIVVDSQLPVLDFKRHLITERVEMAKSGNECIPHLREELFSKRLHFIDRLRARYYVKARTFSRDKWVAYNKDAHRFSTELGPLIKKMDALRRSKKLFSFYAWRHYIKRKITKKVSN